MDDHLFWLYGAGRAGTRWANGFIKQQSKLKTRVIWAYSYQWALYKDPEVIEDWFRLYGNVVAK